VKEKVTIATEISPKKIAVDSKEASSAICTFLPGEEREAMRGFDVPPIFVAA